MILLVSIDTGHAPEATGSIVGEWGFDSVRPARPRRSMLAESLFADMGDELETAFSNMKDLPAG